MVLDFVNDGEDIQNSFRPYYEQAESMPTDPNLLYLAQDKVLVPPILLQAEMRAFADAFLQAEQQAAGSQAKWQKLHAQLYVHLAPAVNRFAELLHSDDEDDVDQAESFRSNLKDYVRKYGFLAQIVPYHDIDLELLHLYGKHLLNVLPRRSDGGVDVGEVDLSYLKLQKTAELDLSLSADGAVVLPGFGDGTGGAQEPEKSLLSELISQFNERFGTEFTEADVAAPFQQALDDPDLQLAALANSNEEDFQGKFEEVFENKMIDNYATQVDLGNRYFSKSDPKFKATLDRQLGRAAWRMIRRQHGDTGAA